MEFCGLPARQDVLPLTLRRGAGSAPPTGPLLLGRVKPGPYRQTVDRTFVGADDSVRPYEHFEYLT